LVVAFQNARDGMEARTKMSARSIRVDGSGYPRLSVELVARPE